MLALLVAFSLSPSVHGQTTSKTEPVVEDLLIQANSRKALAAREIDQLPDRTAGEVARIMAAMDRLFREEIQERFDTHYKEVEQVLQTVWLPEDVGNLETAWSELKAGAGYPSDLENLIESFVRQAQTTLEPQREGLVGHIDRLYRETLTNGSIQAHDNIRAPFLGIVGSHFPSWDVPDLNPPPVPKLPGLQEEDRSRLPGSVVGGVGGLVVYRVVVSKNVIKTAMIERLKRKILGKVAAKAASRVGAAASGAVGGPAAPVVIGSLMAIWGAYDVWNATKAKADLENELRSQFLSTYEEEFSPTAIWNQPAEEGDLSAQKQLKEEISESLANWSKRCRVEVDRILDAAKVYAVSPNIKDYINEQSQKGRHTQEIVEDLLLVGDVFKPAMISKAPIRSLLTMIVDAWDRQELARLAYELDSWLLQEYAEHGGKVLDAAHFLGVPTFLAVVRSDKKLDWYDVRAVFERYPKDLSESARQGLVLALQEQTAPSGVAPAATLETIARHKSLFQGVAPLMAPDTEKVFRLFGNPAVVELVDQAWGKNAEAARAFVSQWPIRTWERYRDDRTRFGALLSVADYRLAERGQAADAFASEIGDRDELTRLFADVGLCGVQLWDAHVGPTAGRHQREILEHAIRLYKDGYPCDDLLTREGLQQARSYDFLPFGLGQELRSLGNLAYYGLIVLVVLVVAVPAVWLVRRLFAVSRLGSPVTEPAPSEPPGRLETD